MKRLPKWLKITLCVLAVLFVLGAIFGRTPENTTATVPTTTTPTPSAPHAETYTVAAVAEADVIRLINSGGGEKVVRILGIDAPAINGLGCFGAEASTWASSLLAGKKVTIRIDSAAANQAGNTLAYLTLPDGTDYSIKALQTGYAKYLADGITASVATTLQSAENAARAAGAGLWGTPCNGNINVPPVTPTIPAPAPATTKAPTTSKAPATTKPPVAESSTPDSGGNVYYANCTAAKAAGTAPLHAGEPGYRLELDRDKDGVACEP